MMLTPQSSAIPTNIITGFLGTGKTTLIKQLLALKPATERWAILVNEFGEVGIDGAFFKGRPENNVYIREVPGGCMCCTSGLPMQIALSQLISYAKPHRLLIEPTGVGHPKEVLATLQQPHYQNMFAIQATLTLVDARTVAQNRYRENLIYQEQLSIADVIIATKTDRYKGDEQTQLTAYLDAQGLTKTPLMMLNAPLKDLSIFDLTQHCAERQRPEKEHEQTKSFSQYPQHAHSHVSSLDTTPDWQRTLEEKGAVMIENAAQGFYSQGWVFSGSKIFNFKDVMKVLSGIETDRLKAVMITEKGIFGFNKVDNALTCTELDECSDSRLEIIDIQPDRVTTAVRELQNTLFAQEA